MKQVLWVAIGLCLLALLAWLGRLAWDREHDQAPESATPQAVPRPPPSTPPSVSAAEESRAARTLALPTVGRATIAISLVDPASTALAGNVRVVSNLGESTTPVTREVTMIEVPAGWPLAVTGEAPDHTESTLASLWLLPDEQRAITLRLEPGRQVAGDVLDEQGLPVAGASIAVRRAGATHPFADTAPSLLAQNTTAKASPSFAFVGIPRLPLEVSAAADGHANQTIVVAEVGDTSNLRLVLGRPEELHGLVHDHERRPIEGARVVAISTQEGPACTEVTRTLQDGTFRFTHLLPGFYTVRAAADKFIAAVKPEVGTGAPNLSFELEAAGSLRGSAPAHPFEIWLFRVQKNGDALTPGALVAQYGFLGSAPEFLIRGLAPGAVLAQLRDDDGWLAVGPLQIDAGVVTPWPPGTRAAAGALAGSVHGANGESVDALVRLLPAGQATAPPAPIPFIMPPRMVRANPAVAITAIAPGDYQLEVLARGYVATRQAVLVTAGTTCDVGVITLQPGADLIARVAGKLRDQELTLELVRGSVSWSATREAPNRFAFRNVAVGTYELRVFRADLASTSILVPRPVEQRSVEVRAQSAIEIDIGG